MSTLISHGSSAGALTSSVSTAKAASSSSLPDSDDAELTKLLASLDGSLVSTLVMLQKLSQSGAQTPGTVATGASAGALATALQTQSQKMNTVSSSNTVALAGAASQAQTSASSIQMSMSVVNTSPRIDTPKTTAVDAVPATTSSVSAQANNARKSKNYG